MLSLYSIKEKKFIGGSQQLSNNLAENLGKSVLLSKAVIHIRQSDDGVIVTDNTRTVYKVIIEPGSSIRYKLACACRADSNQSAHPHSLIRVLVFYLKKRWTLGYPHSTNQGLRSACTSVQADLSP